MKTRKVLSIFLVFVLLVSMTPAVFAAGVPTITVGECSIESGTTSADVTINVTDFSSIAVSGLRLEFTLDSGLSINGATLSSAATEAGFEIDNAGFANGIVSVNCDNDHMVTGVTVPDGELFTLKLTVASDATGTLNIVLSDNQANYLNSSYTSIGNVAVTDGSVTVKSAVAAGYTAGVSVIGNTVTVGKTVTVNVGVSHSSDSAYNAGEIVLNYNSSLMSLVTSSLGELKYTDNNGVLTIEDFGGDKSFATNNYAIVFNTTAVGTANVTLTSAKFVYKDQASSSDLIAATIDPASVGITINEVTYPVTLPTDINFSGNSVATKGEDYTFTVPEIGNYDYEITVTVGGTKIDTVTGPDANGQYTIPSASVTGDIVIIYTREEKTYDVTFSGNAGAEVTDGADKATYNTDYTFTMPSKAGFAYSLESITINGSAYTGYTVAESVYTIPGAAITGPIVITISKSATEASVTVQGDGAGAAAGYDVTAELNGDYTLTITPETGYTYSVTATMGGTTATVIDNQNNTYTIKNVTGAIVFNVTRTLDTSTVAVYEYVAMNDVGSVWLVTYDITLASNKVPTYDGEKMYWSEKYDAYCWLVIANNLTAADAKLLVNVTDGTATTVDYDMDINVTNTTDAADAQLVWNMYNALYDNFISVSMAKFLAADQNASTTDSNTWKLTVEDAQVIINAILNGNANT